MRTRAISAVTLSVLVVLALAGCQARPGTFTRSEAIAADKTWTHSAAAAVGSPRSSAVAAGSENCRTDTGYLVTHFQWRTITNLGVEKAAQASAVAAITAAFAQAGWTAKSTSGIVTLTGPKGTKRRGIVRLEPAGTSQLAVAVTSPCFS